MRDEENNRQVRTRIKTHLKRIWTSFSAVYFNRWWVPSVVIIVTCFFTVLFQNDIPILTLSIEYLGMLGVAIVNLPRKRFLNSLFNLSVFIFIFISLSIEFPPFMGSRWYYTWRYVRAEEKSEMLKDYEAYLYREDSGGIPLKMDRMFSKEFRETEDFDKRKAIMLFYIGRTERCHEGDYISEDGEKLISFLINIVDSLNEKEKMGALHLIENARQERQLYKATLYIHETKTINDVVSAYKICWEKELEWPEKKKIDPLEGWTEAAWGESG